MRFAVGRIIACVALFAAVLATAGNTSPAPATRPGLSAADAALLGQLETGDWRHRHAAAQTLTDRADRGEETEQTIAAMLAATGNADVKAQLNGVLLHIHELQESGPSLITLHVKDGAPREVYQELFRQALCPMPLDGVEWSAGKSAAKLDVDVERRPFWEVFPKLAERSGVALGDPVSGLIAGPPIPDGPHELYGPFLIVATGWDYYLNVEANPKQKQGPGSIVLDISIFAEPKMLMMAAMGGVKVEKADDEKGNSLLGKGLFLNTNQIEPDDRCRVNLVASLKTPEFHHGARLALFRGTASVTVRTASRDILIADPLHAAAQDVAVPGMTVRFEGCRKEGDGYVVTMTHVYPFPVSTLISMNRIFADMHLDDSTGHRVACKWHDMGTSGGMTNDFVSEPAAPGQSGLTGEPVKMQCVVSSRFKTIDIPIEFKGLDLDVSTP